MFPATYMIHTALTKSPPIKSFAFLNIKSIYKVNMKFIDQKPTTKSFAFLNIKSIYKLNMKFYVIIVSVLFQFILSQEASQFIDQSSKLAINPITSLDLFLQLEDEETYEKVNSEDIQLDSQFYEEQSSLDADEIYNDQSEEKTDNYDGNLWEV